MSDVSLGNLCGLRISSNKNEPFCPSGGTVSVEGENGSMPREFCPSGGTVSVEGENSSMPRE